MRTELQFASARLGKTASHVITVYDCGVDAATRQPAIVMARYLKPANVMWCDSTWRLVDFGIAAPQHRRPPLACRVLTTPFPAAHECPGNPGRFIPS